MRAGKVALDHDFKLCGHYYVRSLEFNVQRCKSVNKGGFQSLINAEQQIKRKETQRLSQRAQRKNPRVPWRLILRPFAFKSPFAIAPLSIERKDPIQPPATVHQHPSSPDTEAGSAKTSGHTSLYAYVDRGR